MPGGWPLILRVTETVSGSASRAVVIAVSRLAIAAESLSRTAVKASRFVNNEISRRNHQIDPHLGKPGVAGLTRGTVYGDP